MKITIQYSAINPKGYLQHFLKEVTVKKYNTVYLNNPKVLNLEILTF